MLAPKVLDTQAALLCNKVPQGPHLNCDLLSGRLVQRQFYKAKRSAVEVPDLRRGHLPFYRLCGLMPLAADRLPELKHCR